MGRRCWKPYDVPESELDLDDSNSDLFTVGKKVKIDLGDMDYRTWRDELQKDADTLELLLLMMKDIRRNMTLNCRRYSLYSTRK